VELKSVLEIDEKIGNVWVMVMVDLFCPDDLEMAGVSLKS
jgi:hypothetical protein